MGTINVTDDKTKSTIFHIKGAFHAYCYYFTSTFNVASFISGQCFNGRTVAVVVKVEFIIHFAVFICRKIIDVYSSVYAFAF